MNKKVVITGRGGTGKTTLVALLAKYFNPSLLLIDADPDQSLADMLGIDLDQEEIKTISEVLLNVSKETGSEQLGSLSLPEKIEYLLNSDCLYESKKFDLLSLGVKWSKGCYCLPNNILRSIIPRLSQNYQYTLIDSPAGLEHLNRRVIEEIEDIFVLLDPSLKSRKNVGRIRKIAREIGMKFENLYLVANHRFTEATEKYIKDEPGTYLGKIEYDSKVEEYNLLGKSLLDLPENSPASLSVEKILSKAGYKVRSLEAK